MNPFHLRPLVGLCLFSFLLLAAFIGCAGTPEVPPDYTAPSTVAEKPLSEGPSTASPDGHVPDGEDDDGWTVEEGDCDNGDATVYPGAAELCDGKDNNCDGPVDEGLNRCDFDRDGFTSESEVRSKRDCDPVDAAVYPGAAELCDGKDNNCDGPVDDHCEEPVGHQ